MTAPFASELCGYRPGGQPSTSDASQSGSIIWGKALFEELGVPIEQPAVQDVGAKLEQAVVADLGAHPPDLSINRSRKSSEYEQYMHLAVFSKFESSYRGPSAHLEQALAALRSAPSSGAVLAAVTHVQAAQESANADDALIGVLMTSMADESLLQLGRVSHRFGGHRGRLTR